MVRHAVPNQYDDEGGTPWNEGSILSVRVEPEREVPMRRKVILVTVMMALVRVVIASASPVIDAVLVALAVLLLATVWDEFTNARP